MTFFVAQMTNLLRLKQTSVAKRLPYGISGGKVRGQEVQLGGSSARPEDYPLPAIIQVSE